MIKLINELNTIACSLVSVKEKYKSVKHEIKNNFFINVYGDLKACNKIMICLHGAGGNKTSNHVIHFCNTFMDEFTSDGCYITFDMPGIEDNIFIDKFWGAQINSIDIHLDDIIEYVTDKNQTAKIFISAVSASTTQLLAYMTDKKGAIKNKFKNKVKYFYLVSPAGEVDETLNWIYENSGYHKYISFYHTYSQAKFLLKNSKYKKLKNIVQCFFDIKKSNYFINDCQKYEFDFNTVINNCDVILSKYDTITEYNITINFLNKFNKINLIHYNLGGHVGFSNINFKKRKHEQYIIESIKKYF